MTRTQLYAPYPNPPVAAGTTLRFDLARHAEASLDVFDVAGRRVAKLAQRSFEPGRYRLQWDGRDDAGRTLRSGVYFLRLSGAGISTATVRLTFVR